MNARNEKTAVDMMMDSKKKRKKRLFLTFLPMSFKHTGSFSTVLYSTFLSFARESTENLFHIGGRMDCSFRFESVRNYGE